ncbi:MAG: hypothetical protein DRO73_08395 [Candidatus Thorarchaeota archaeon]|nr:MAG: hypothetical protein DRO73_08395 [Candidatus Thorarchaeota archaeon]RLI56953.1 MAG: hypothetical protein DRO93_10920 [Candidatus Thorarchaeota archaeon]
MNLNDVPRGVEICVELTATARTIEVTFDHLLPLAPFELHTFQYENNGVDLLRLSDGWSWYTRQGDKEQILIT